MAAERLSSQRHPRVVIADERVETRAWLGRALSGAYQIEDCATTGETVAILDARPPEVVIVGGKLRDVAAREIVLAAKAAAESGGGPPVPVLIVDDGPEAGGDREAIERLGQDPGVYYVIRRPLPAAEVRRLVDSAVYRPAPQPEPEPDVSSAEDASRLRRVLEAARRLGAARNLEAATSILVREVVELANADRAQCLFFDADSGVLWIEGEDEELELAAAAGIAGFAARTSTAVSAPRAASDPRYVPAIDDPKTAKSGRLYDDIEEEEEATRVSQVMLTASGGDERIFAQPIASADGEVHAVLVAGR